MNAPTGWTRYGAAVSSVDATGPASRLALRNSCDSMCTWFTFEEREFKLPWREAVPPNNFDVRGDSDQ